MDLAPTQDTITHLLDGCHNSSAVEFFLTDARYNDEIVFLTMDRGS